MKTSTREERRMRVSVPKISVLMRWVGPAAIAGGVFMVLSDLSGLPITIPYLSTTSPSGFDAVGTGLILFALTLLLVGMVGLYARTPAHNAAKVIDYGEAYQDVPRVEVPVTEEVRHETAEEQAETLALRSSSRAGALVLGTGLVLFFLLRH
jgi:hypothetical protein